MDAVLTHDWQRTSALMAAVYNAQLGRKQPVRPQSLNPYRGLFAVEEPDDLETLARAFGVE